MEALETNLPLPTATVKSRPQPVQLPLLGRAAVTLFQLFGMTLIISWTPWEIRQAQVQWGCCSFRILNKLFTNCLGDYKELSWALHRREIRQMKSKHKWGWREQVWFFFLGEETYQGGVANDILPLGTVCHCCTGCTVKGRNRALSPGASGTRSITWGFRIWSFVGAKCSRRSSKIFDLGMKGKW